MLIQLIASAIALSVAPIQPPQTSPADTITVGHRALGGRTPRLGVDTTEIYVDRDGKRQLINTGITQVTRTSDGILVVFVSRGRNGLSLDSITIDPKTYAPLRHVETFPDKHSTLAFGNGRLTGSSKDSTGEHAVDVAVAARLFDFSVVQQISSALPLEPGYEAVILAYDVSPMKERAITYRVLSPEHITWHGGDVATWKTVMDFGTHQVTRWVDAKTRRDLQWDITAPNMHMVGITK